MKKLVFKNKILNIIVGIVLIVFTTLAYFLGWYDDALPIILGVLLLLISTKRFIFAYNKTISKKTTLIMSIEYLLDVILVGLLLYLRQDTPLFVGLIIYLRGITYLMVNYTSNKKIIFNEYILNIFYITIGAFFIFTGIDIVTYLIYITAALVLVIGLIFLLLGLSEYQVKRKKKKTVKTNNTNKTATNPKPQAQVDYSKMTLAELQIIAKERGLTGFSNLNKADLISKLNK